MFLWTAFIVGLVGSAHCAGMCGPIALALPLKAERVSGKILSGFVYNIGRTLTYAFMGAVFGLLGLGLNLFGVQKWIGIVMGSLMIISIILPKLITFKFIPDSAFSFTGKIKSTLIKLFTLKSTFTIFLIGIVNGFLPCGLVYIAIAGAIGTGNIFTGVYFMTAFGLGTLPMLLGISLLGNLSGIKFRNKMNKIIPYAVVLVGAFFILRGLNLGIPFVSPKTEMIEQKFEDVMKVKTPCEKTTVEKEKLPCCH